MSLSNDGVRDSYGVGEVREALGVLARCNISGSTVEYDSLAPNGQKFVDVVKKRYLEGLALGDIGKEMGLTGERARQVEKMGLQTLKKIMNKII